MSFKKNKQPLSLITAPLKPFDPLVSRNIGDFSDLVSPYPSIPPSGFNSSRLDSGHRGARPSLKWGKPESSRGSEVFPHENLGFTMNASSGKPGSNFQSFPRSSSGLGEKFSRSLLNTMGVMTKTEDLRGFQKKRKSVNFDPRETAKSTTRTKRLGSSMTNFHWRSSSESSSRFYSSKESAYTEKITLVDSYHKNQVLKGSSDVYTNLKNRAQGKLNNLLEKELKLSQKEIDKIMGSDNPYAMAFEMQAKLSLGQQANQNNDASMKEVFFCFIFFVFK